MIYCNGCAILKGWPVNTTNHMVEKCDICKATAKCNILHNDNLTQHEQAEPGNGTM